MTDTTTPRIDLTTLALHGWAAAHDRMIHATAIVPKGYELRTLVRQVDAVWHDGHEAQAEAEIREAYERMHGAPPLGVTVVEEPCVRGARALTGPIQALVVARSTRLAKKFHAPVPQQAPAPEPEPEPPAAQKPTPEPEPEPAEETPVPIQTAPTMPKRRRRQKRTAKSKPTASEPAPPSYVPGTLDHRPARQANPGISVDLHYPTTPSGPTDRTTIARSVGALAAANPEATDDELRQIIHMLTDPIRTTYGTKEAAA